MSAPERIYQLEISGLPCDFPLLKTIEAGMKDLPVPGASFVSRASELEAIERLLDDPGCRLLTLVGPGGVARPGSCSMGMWGVYRDVYAEAAAFSAEGAELARASGDGIAESGGLMDLGFARLLMNDLDSAREAFDAAHAVSGGLGNPILRAYATSKLGLLADAEERFGDALRFHLEAHDLFASVGEAAGLGYALSRASMSAFGLGDYSEALRLGRAGYEAFSESNHRWGLITALCRMALRHSPSETAPRRVSGSATRSSGRTTRRPCRSSFLH